MKLFARRPSRAPLALSLVLAAVFGLGIPQLRGAPPPVHAQETDRASVLLNYWTAANNHDVDGALAQFADNAFFIGSNPTGGCSRQAPCTDLAGIRQQIQGDQSRHQCTTVRWLQVSGDVVTAERENRNDTIRTNGVERIVLDVLAVIPQDKITFFAAVSNLADPETALNAAISAGTQPAGTPIPSPTTPCAPLLP